MGQIKQPTGAFVAFMQGLLFASCVALFTSAAARIIQRLDIIIGLIGMKLQ